MRVAMRVRVYARGCEAMLLMPLCFCAEMRHYGDDAPLRE